MARIRTIKPEFFRSRSLSRVSRDARLTFAGMWCEADCMGRGVADARILKGSIWPLEDDITPDVIANHLSELAVEHIDIYEVDGETYYQVRKWEKHQAASYRQGEPVHPSPPSDEPCTDSHESCMTPSAVREGKGREGKASGDALHDAPGFDAFWSIYPRKTARKKAETAWRNLTQADRDAAIGALPAHCARWDDPRYVPHPSTWLNGRRWEDVLPADKRTVKANGVTEAWSGA